jgi:cellulose synthase/poly-beta-1,6-N-acetylglucosamine synthase-like glycosyltransferase
MTLLEWAFWALTLVVVYVYAGYPLLVSVLARLARQRTFGLVDTPPRVSLIFCVHNELPILRQKLANCASLDYPQDRLEVLAGSDGSTDGSNELLAEAQERGRLRAILQTSRTGKTSLLNRVVEQATGEILIFTDASTLLAADAVWSHVRHYADTRVGCVGGDLRFANVATGGVSAGHGLYWRYEAWIRTNESALGTLAYVPGANYSMRRALWKPVPPEFADDCVSPLNVVAAGRRVRYDPNADAKEVASESTAGLFTRRVRMVTRDLEATLRFGYLLNPFRRPGLALSLLSHKLLRWFVPVALALILIMNVALAHRPVYLFLLILQLTFYGLASIASLQRERPRNPLLTIPLYFSVSNLGAFRGLINVLMRRRIEVWRPVGVR